MKKYSGKLLSPLARKISSIPANYVTLGSLLSCIGCFFGAYYNFIGVLILCLFLIEFFDQLDGLVARNQGSTQFGAFWDSTLDRYGDAVLFLGILLGNYTTPLICFLAMIGAFITSYTRARTEALGIKTLGGVGLFERTDRIPLLFFGAILQIWFNQALWWTMLIMVVGTHITALQRIYFAYNHLSRVPEKKIENQAMKK